MLVPLKTKSGHPSSSDPIFSPPKTRAGGWRAAVTAQHMQLCLSSIQEQAKLQFLLQIPLPTCPSHAVSAETLVCMGRGVPSSSGQDIISPRERFGEISALPRLAQQIRSNICGWTPSSGNHSTRHGASPPPATHGDPTQGIKPFFHRYYDYYYYFHSLTIYMLCRCCWTSTPTAQQFLMEILQKWGWNG